MKFSPLTFLAAGLLSASTVAAHGELLSRTELSRRGALAKRCSSHVARLNEKRYAKRMAKRGWGTGNSTVEVTTAAPYYDVLQNDTCVLSTEITGGPYTWLQSQLLRQDTTEGQPGVPVWLDIGLIDMGTCEPLEGALVSIWSANATGSYSSFTGVDPNTPFKEVIAQHGLDNFTVGETDFHTDDTTFLRGMWPTNAEGLAEIKTIYPGFYAGRAIHIHAQVYTDWTLYGNGTLRSQNVVSTGQLYFEEDVSARIMSLEPYVSHTEIVRRKNSEDRHFADGMSEGFNPVMTVVPADGENIDNGVVAYITMGIDPTDVKTGDAEPVISVD
ncbi:dioxygenase [Diaporthe sp. PMI_573]|jgi:protocatechuate 3,4-dioxygenase beta subunit|nr:dioxygenase [Diaporthaceae sp. PMI_573]